MYLWFSGVCVLERCSETGSFIHLYCYSQACAYSESDSAPCPWPSPGGVPNKRPKRVLIAGVRCGHMKTLDGRKDLLTRLYK